MLKKLQDLLFEEEEDLDDEEEETVAEPASYTPEVTPVQAEAPKPAETVEEPVPAPAPAPAPAPVPVFKSEETVEVRPAMQRIDVTQPIPTQKPRREQARNESVFREPAPAAPSFDIKVDDAPAVQQSRPKPKPAAKAARQDKPRSSGYQFQPVISPIFGVDEKDMNALKTTTTKISEVQKAKNDPNVSPIISPMYGMNQEDKPSNIQKTVRKSNEQEEILATPQARKAEDEIPEFSLDDILKVRDEEYAKAVGEASEETAPLFPDLNLWDDEPESAEDATIVIEKPLG